MNNHIEKKKEYEKWVGKACDFVKKVGSQINMPAGAMQSDISIALDNDINIMFLGHDAHEVPEENYKFVSVSAVTSCTQCKE